MLLSPHACVGCGRSGLALCPRCAVRLPPPPLLDVPPGLDSLTVLTAYEGLGRQLLVSLKFRNQRGSLGWMAEHLVMGMSSLYPEVVTWVPASDGGKWRRGFDTGQLLARRVGHGLGVPVRPLLRRAPGSAQLTRALADRERGPDLRATRWLRSRPPYSVVLIDDVCTTGASLSAAAQQLRHAGVLHVDGAVVARTPLHAFDTA